MLTFDRVMDKASVETAMQVKPEVPFNMEWFGDTQASIKLAQPLEPGKRYRFTLAEIALDTRGVSLDNTYSWEYWLEPLVKQEKSPDVFNRSAAVVMRFNYPVDPKSVDKVLTITPSFDATLDCSTSGTVLNILPNTPLINGAFYPISFSAPLMESNGMENEKLNTTSHEATLYQEERYFWEEYGYNNKEIHGNQVSFCIREAGAGEYVFTYLPRATHAGSYFALPAEAYTIYHTTKWGRSGSVGFIIVK